MIGRRVVFFDAYPHEVTGAQRATLLLMEGLRERAWRSHLALPAEGPFADVARERGFGVTILPVPPALRVYGRQTTGRRAALAAASMPIVWGRARRWLRREADIVHVCDHRGQLLLGPAAAAARRPVVWHVHGVDTNRWLNRVCAALARRIVVPSRAAADRMPGLEWRQPAIIIPNALPARMLDAPPRQPAAAPTITTLVRVHPDKGIDVLMDALARLRARVPDARCEVVGATQHGYEDYATGLLQRRDALGLAAAMEFVGRVVDPGPTLARAHVYVQSSRERTEQQPLAVLEAMAAGVPIVATRVGGVAEMLGDGRFGVLVPPEDPAALADGIAGVIADPAAAAARAAAAQTHVRALCRPERFVDQVLDVYASL